MYIYITYIFIGPPVYQCGEHWSGGPGSLVRGAKEKLSIPPVGCPQESVSHPGPPLADLEICA